MPKPPVMKQFSVYVHGRWTCFIKAWTLKSARHQAKARYGRGVDVLEA